MIIVYGCDNLSDTRVVIDIREGNTYSDTEVSNYRRLFNSDQVCTLFSSQWEESGFVNEPHDINAFLKYAT